jgi:hypothetical protein
MEFDRITSLVGDLVNYDRLLKPAGVEKVALERFLTGWSRGLGVVAFGELPRAAMFVLRAVNAPLADAGVYAQLIHAIESAQRKHAIISCDEGGTILSEFTDSDVTHLVPAMEWRLDQVNQVSAQSLAGKCVVFANNYAVDVLVSGVVVHRYSDVRSRTKQSVRETLIREEWSPELLRRCAREYLCRRGRRGIWHEPNEHVLRHHPEELIEDILREFFVSHLSGFRALIRQYHWDAKGRVDVFLELSNGLRVVIELKWVGRAIKKEPGKLTKSVSYAQKWRCPSVSVIGPNEALEGLPQLKDYLDTSDTHLGVLAVFDCRKPTMIASETIETRCGVARCLVVVAPVDPTNPSMLASTRVA